jgi:hypothetical protein
MGNSVRHNLGYGYGLVQGHAPSRPQYSTISVREAKYTHLGYRTRLSRLHTLDPQLALDFLRSSHSATLDPKQENNQGTLD